MHPVEIYRRRHRVKNVSKKYKIGRLYGTLTSLLVDRNQFFKEVSLVGTEVGKLSLIRNERASCP